MLDNLRAMGVFVCVVKRQSFSGAAKVLGITTSAVSQQIRSLEQDLNVTLLHRSTRKITLTEAGHAFFQSCQEMMAAAERAKIRISELQDHLMGELRLATTPELAAMHIVPALSKWLWAHERLNVWIEASNQYIDLIEQKIDIAVRMSPYMETNEDYEYVLLARVEQIIVASPTYLHQHPPIESPQQLEHLNLLPISLIKDYNKFEFIHRQSEACIKVQMPYRIKTNNVFVFKSLCQNGHGVGRVLYPDVQDELRQGVLIEVLPEWKLPEFMLYAVLLKREQQPIKVIRCLDVLKSYFSQLPGGR